MGYKSNFDLKPLFELIETLRGPEGCPWDKKQTPGSLSGFLIEEACEANDSIQTGSNDEIIDELGDVLFQLCFIIQLFQEKGCFSLEDVVKKSLNKMISRHPHVFGEESAETPEDVEKTWKKVKSLEKGSKLKSVFENIPSGLPALMLALKISKAAVGEGFEWDNIEGVLDKVSEELDEFKESLLKKDENEKVMEFGDILFTLVNVGRFWGIESESALLMSSRKFEKRFRWMEEKACFKGTQLKKLPRRELENLWNESKDFY